MEAYGSIFFGRVILNEGEVVRPSQLIARVRQTVGYGNGILMAHPVAARIVSAFGATALGTIGLAGEQPSSQWENALHLARAVTIKSDNVVVNPDELKAAGIDPGSFTPPKRVKGSSPSYPESAARDNAQGTVRLECLITEAGAVQGCRITRSVHPAADREAVKTIQHWKYESARVMAQPRSIVAEFVMIFRLE